MNIYQSSMSTVGLQCCFFYLLQSQSKDVFPLTQVFCLVFTSFYHVPLATVKELSCSSC